MNGPSRANFDVAVMAAMAGAIVVAVWAWAAGQVAGWLAGGRWPQVPVSEGAGVFLRLPGNLSDPRMAWPLTVRPGLPGPALMYATAAGLVALPATVALVWRGSRARQNRRPGRGARWASGVDLGAIRVRRTARGSRLIMGRALGASPLRPLIATEARHSVLVIGPTQSGKTSGLAVPALLTWPGPVIATSVKDDLAGASLSWRERQGPCWLFDPTGTTGLPGAARWSPLAACGDWSGAQRVAGWLVDATPARAGLADAAFWYAAAAKQLAPLLLAAARAGAGMAAVVRWTNATDFEEPMRLLELSSDEAAAGALAACAGRDERIRSSVATTLETVLAPFEDPVVAAFTSASDVRLDGLLAESGTLYLCGPSHEQYRVQGLFASLVSAAVAQAIKRANGIGGPLDPPLLVVLDEAANIAPIRDLDALASTGAGIGIQLVTICQDLAQLAARYGSDRSRTIANNHRAKLVLSGVSDLTTLDLVSGLAGEQAVTHDTVTHDHHDGRRSTARSTTYRRLAPTDELRRIPPGQGVLVYGHLPPVRVGLRPWYRDRRLARRAGAAQPGFLARLGATRGGSPGIFG